jgi:glucokinase
MTVLGGVDIGGTKCAVTLGVAEEGTARIAAKKLFPTPGTPEEAMRLIRETMRELLAEQNGWRLEAIGVSCGGPLDSRSGLVLSPPNLPLWDRIDCVSPLRESFGVPVALQNDANACALAEWKWGAGKGTRNMVFLTFGTGMGAGLILDGKLYSGTNDMAGEVGHMRLSEDGPVGYGKAGSFEGYCSGGGIARLARVRAEEAIGSGSPPSFCRSLELLETITAKTVGEAAEQRDPLALDIYRTVGRMLGRGLAVLVDVLNPELIVLGSIYGRQRSLLEPAALEELRRESLALPLSVCRIVPAGLGEQVGDFAGLSVAMNALQR